MSCNSPATWNTEEVFWAKYKYLNLGVTDLTDLYSQYKTDSFLPTSRLANMSILT